MLQFPGIESDKAFCFTEKEINQEREKINKILHIPLSALINEMRIYLFKDLNLTVRKDYLDENFDIKIKEMNFCLTLVRLYVNEILTFESEWAKITEDNIYNEQNIMLHFAEAIEEFSAVNKEELKNIIITELRVMSNDNMFKVMRKFNTLYVAYDLENHIEEHITKNGKWNIYSTDFKIFGLQQYILQLKIKGVSDPKLVTGAHLTIYRHGDYRAIAWMMSIYENNVKNIANTLFNIDCKEQRVSPCDRDIIFHAYETKAKTILRSNESRAYKKFFSG